ncbi:hypothetical protein GCM10009799_01730 [Nocardiopsis rhodophaea]|uniref:Uncharacterized protein n=1 Tax=Nocardiopsis rhodophaea TaxID=280238 RepID=A0ABN2S4I2_9ACTN
MGHFSAANGSGGALGENKAADAHADEGARKDRGDLGDERGNGRSRGDLMRYAADMRVGIPFSSGFGRVGRSLDRVLALMERAVPREPRRRTAEKLASNCPVHFHHREHNRTTRHLLRNGTPAFRVRRGLLKSVLFT